MVSLAIHAILIIGAVSFVAVRVYVKDDQTFEAQPVSRPRMKLKKLTVPINIKKKKVQKPKLRKTIVSKPKTTSIDIKMPEMSGIKGGMGYLKDGGGLGGIGFGLDLDLFGSSTGAGNAFIGTLYDLKQTKRGEPSGIEEGQFIEIINSFVGSGFSESKLKRFFSAPKKKFTKAFMLPPMGAHEAPKAFGVENQVQPRLWVCHYKGQIAAPETGRYRFWGLGDDILSVRIGNKLVLDACWFEHSGKLSRWASDDENSRRFVCDTQFPPSSLTGYMRENAKLVIGDWFTLKKGKKVDMEVLIGEFPGGLFLGRLLIEQQGVEYRMVASDGGMRPVLPIFKTTPVEPELIDKMKIDPNVATVEGPVFGALINTK